MSKYCLSIKNPCSDVSCIHSDKLAYPCICSHHCFYGRQRRLGREETCTVCGTDPLGTSSSLLQTEPVTAQDFFFSQKTWVKNKQNKTKTNKPTNQPNKKPTLYINTDIDANSSEGHSTIYGSLWSVTDTDL